MGHINHSKVAYRGLEPGITQLLLPAANLKFFPIVCQSLYMPQRRLFSQNLLLETFYKFWWHCLFHVVVVAGLKYETFWYRSST